MGMNMRQVPVSPATSVTTPSTTHSVPTPTGMVSPTSLLQRAKTPNSFLITTPTTMGSVTPTSTPPSAQSIIATAMNGNVNVFAPQTANSTNVNMLANGINGLSMNVNGNGLSPLPLLPIINNNNGNNSPSFNSPIVLTPSTNLLLQQQMNGTVKPSIFGPLGTPPSYKSTTHLTPNTKSKHKNKNNWSKEEEQLGNELHRIVKKQYPKRASKIVGMLLKGNKIENIRMILNTPSMLEPMVCGYNQKLLEKELRKRQQSQ